MSGGVVYNNGLNLALTRTSINRTTINAVGGAGGGGGFVSGGEVYNNGNDLSAGRVALDANVIRLDGGSGGGGGGASGGVLYHNGHTLAIARASLSNNSTSARGGGGGGGGFVSGEALYDNSSSPYATSISASRFGANSVNVDGGSSGGGGGGSGLGLYLNGYQLTIGATTVDGNSATARGHDSAAGGAFDGGGMYVNVPSTMTNVTVSGDSLDASGGSTGTGGIAVGGGIYGNDALTLLNSTISDNSVRAPGMTAGTARGGNLLHGVPATHVKNTIVSGGHGDAGYENCREPFGSDGHNIDSLDQCGFHGTGDQIHKSPLLAVLKNNGGPVPTRGLLPHSPAFNMGDNTGCPSADARGGPRPAFGICDIGAFEAQPAPVISGLLVKPKRFRPPILKHKRGTTVSYSDSRAALTTFTVLRQAPGVLKGGLCVRPPKKHTGHPKRCTRYVRVGSFVHQDVIGANHFHFSGRIKGHELPPGRYRLRATPSLWAVTGRPKATGFEILP